PTMAKTKRRAFGPPLKMGHVRSLQIAFRGAPGGAALEDRQLAATVQKRHSSGSGFGFLLGAAARHNLPLMGLYHGDRQVVTQNLRMPGPRNCRGADAIIHVVLAAR